MTRIAIGIALIFGLLWILAGFAVAEPSPNYQCRSLVELNEQWKGVTLTQEQAAIKAQLEAWYYKNCKTKRIHRSKAKLIRDDGRYAQHNHPAQDIPIHEQFYSTWFMPDAPTKSCCNKADCYPTEAKLLDNHWHARRREDGAWILVPENKIERNRDNPDGRSHVCMPPPGANYPAGTVFCFSLGNGA